MENIREEINAYLQLWFNEENHRFKSWEHCYRYFDTENIDEDLASLHLAFYLASWGMYRGSTFLLQRDYKFLLPVVQIILQHRDMRTKEINHNTKETFLNELFEIKPQLEAYFSRDYPGLKKPDREASDTLLTKILLGTLGSTPAYDRLFKKGLKSYPYTQAFGKTSMGQLIDFAIQHENEIRPIQQEKKDERGFDIPVMKVIDIYFWQKGRLNSER
jgi:hypothetical protein